MWGTLELHFKLEGADTLSRVLENENTKLKNFKVPLQESSDYLLKVIRANFDSEGSLVGGWKPLALATVRGRTNKGYGGEHPILVNTGKYKSSFKAIVNSTKMIIDAWGVTYHKYHQSIAPRIQGKEGDRLPRRATLFLKERDKMEINRVFQEYLHFSKE